MVIVLVRWSARRRFTWIAWAACGKGSPGVPVELHVTDLSAAVSALAGPIVEDRLAPGHGLERRCRVC
jgi:hypothetical protein